MTAPLAILALALLALGVVTGPLNTVIAGITAGL